MHLTYYQKSQSHSSDTAVPFPYCYFSVYLTIMKSSRVSDRTLHRAVSLLLFFGASDYYKKSQSPSSDTAVPFPYRWCTLLRLKVSDTRAGYGSAVSLQSGARRTLHRAVSLLKTIGRLGNASRERKSASVFVMPDK